MDWTIKLWNPEKEKQAIYTFESSHDWIYDVQWSPKHPAVFASVNNSGYVDIWNINQNKEMPVVRWPEENEQEKLNSRKEQSHAPLNCLRWSADGRRLITGDALGKVTLFQVHNDLVNPSEDDFKNIVKLVEFESR